MHNSIPFKTILIFIVTVLLILAFLGGFNTQSSRSIGELWNLGHLILFGLLIFTISISWEKYQNYTNLKRFVFILILTSILSILIETFQYIFKNGTPDLNDVRRNFVGAIGCFLLITTFKKKTISVLLRTFTIFTIFLEIIPTGTAILDEIIAIKQFPVLSDFENDIEISRWSGDASFKRNMQISEHGKSSLHIIFGTEKYSGLALNYFPRDWSVFKSLNYNIYYPDSDSLFFTCRIHDKQHAKGEQKYIDRFNQRFKFKFG